MKLTKKQKKRIMVFRFFVYLFLVSFVVSVSFFLFFHALDIERAAIERNMLSTLINVLFLSVLICGVDLFRSYKKVEKPLERITESLEKIAGGDFSEQIEPVPSLLGINEFNPIIENINLLTKELSSVETLRSDFVSNVSHELKTPLSVISNYSTLLQNPNISEEERLEYAAAIGSTASRLADMISNILKLSKLENQQIYPHKSQYSLSEQICECLLQFESVWEEKELNIETDIDDDVLVVSDEELLSIVWNNLFSNAVKFTDKGGTVSVSVKQAENKIIITVSDTGCGMSEATAKHIFEKFYQGDTSHSSQGNGLGLALVREILDATGGSIAVNSTAGKGTTFTVTL